MPALLCQVPARLTETHFLLWPSMNVNKKQVPVLARRGGAALAFLGARECHVLCKSTRPIQRCMHFKFLNMVIDRRKATLFSSAAALRLILFFAFPSLPVLLTGRVEISTPVTSFKRCKTSCQCTACQLWLTLFSARRPLPLYPQCLSLRWRRLSPGKPHRPSTSHFLLLIVALRPHCCYHYSPLSLPPSFRL